MQAWLSFVAFQVIWFACVLGAARAHSLLGPLLLLAWLPVHFLLSRCRREDAALALLALVFGLVIDSLYINGGLLRFHGASLLELAAPWWILALWVNFALSLNHCMRWLHGRWLAGLLFGAVGGPLSYYAGVRLGAAEALAGPVMLYGVIALAWALVMALLLRLPWLTGASET